MRRKSLVDWDSVADSSLGCHRPLLAKHGLVDCFTMSSALDEMDNQAQGSLRGQGLTAWADWIGREAGRSTVALLLPEHVVQPVWSRQGWAWGWEGPERWLVLWNLICTHLPHLDYLDRHMGLSPRLWVRRSWARLSPAVERRLAGRQFAMVCYHHPLLELPEKEHAQWKDGWILGIEPGLNQWLRAEALLAAKRLTGLSAGGIDRRIKAGEHLLAGGETSDSCWDEAYHPRKVQVKAYDEDAGKSRVETVTMELPELGAIPFYHVGQLAHLHEAITAGRVSFSLLGELTDSSFKRGRITWLRDTLGYPVAETRGRLKRTRERVREVGRLADSGVSKYGIAKRLGMPRSSVYDYLAEYESMRASEVGE